MKRICVCSGRRHQNTVQIAADFKTYEKFFYSSFEAVHFSARLNDIERPKI